MSSFFKEMRIRPADIILFILFAAAACISVYTIRQKRTGDARLVIDGPEGRYLYDMHVNREIAVPGMIGNSIIVIQNGKARFKDSPCPGKTCVQCAPISHNHEWIACMPNQIFIRIEQEEQPEHGAGQDEPDISSF